LMILCLCLASTAGLTFFVYCRAVYWSVSLIKVTSVMPTALDDEAVYHDNSHSEIIGRLESPVMIERVARKLGLEGDYRDIANKYIKKTSFEFQPNGGLEVEVWAYSYNLAKVWVETLVEEYNRSREEGRIKYRDSIINSYTQEISRIAEKQDLTTHENLDHEIKQALNETNVKVNQYKDIPTQLLNYKRRIAQMRAINEKLENPELSTVERLSLLNSIKDKVNMRIGRMLSLAPSTQASTAQTEAADQTKEAEPNADELKVGDDQLSADNSPADQPTEEKQQDQKVIEGGKAGATTNFVVVPSVLETKAPWETLELRQRQLESKIKAASQLYLPGHRIMRKLLQDLENTTRALENEYDLAKNRFDLELKDLENKEKETEAKIPEYESVMAKYAEISRESQVFSSKQIAFDGMVTGMSKKLELFDWTADRERTKIDFADILEIKPNPVAPVRLKIFLMSLFGGLVLAIGIPFLIEYLDHTVSTFEEVEGLVPLRGLGIIPQVSSIEKERPVLLNDQNEDQNLVENFRVIRSNLLSFGTLNMDTQVIMITSSMPKEGKTVVSSNLALSFAQTGAKTLLLDTDLRRGRLHRLFGLRKSPGLSGVLTGAITLEEACRSSGD